MKAFIATAFVLCYFLPEGVKGGSEITFDLSPAEVDCVETNGCPLSLADVYHDLDYLKHAFEYLARYDSDLLNKIHLCAPWKNGVLDDTEKNCLRAVIPGRVMEAQNMIDDVRKVFLKTAFDEPDVYQNIWDCIKYGEIKPPPSGYYALKTESAACAKKLISDDDVKQLDLYYFHFLKDFKYFKVLYGEDDISYVYKKLCVVGNCDFFDRALRHYQGNELFDPLEKRNGNRLLPGQFHFLENLLSRFGDGFRDVTNPGDLNTAIALKDCIRKFHGPTS